MSFDKRNYAPDVPYIHGMRVCLNPDITDYRRQNERVQGNAGYVVQSDAANEEMMLKWKTFSPTTRADIHCAVEWDNGWRGNYQFFMLLPVDSPAVDTIHIRLGNGNHYTGLPDKTYKVADEYVFGEGVKVRSIFTFDNEWRGKMLKLLD